jgi:hypothetical protein
MMRLVPDPVETEEQYRRFWHLDIAGLDDTDIIDELHALRPLLWWKLPGDEWLRERVRMLGIELTKRHNGKRQGVRR